MPTRCGQNDSKGYFCRWGSSGKKYYYTKGDKASMARARKKADAQGAAAHASGYRGAIEKQGGKVQALVFNKSKFTVSTAKSWAKSHGFKTYTDRETKNTIRLRQFPPEKCTRSGGMKQLESGIQAYICPVKASKCYECIYDKLTKSLDRIQNCINVLYEREKE